MNILVVQHRTDQTEDHEQKCFQDFSHLDADFNFVNGVSNELNKELLDSHGGVILGGSTEFLLTRDHDQEEWLKNSYNFIDLVLEHEVPTLGICFGFQLMVHHLGGEVVNDENYHEIGSFKVEANQSHADQCEIFSKLPEKFEAQLGHTDTPIKLPENSIPLIISDRAPYQAFRLKGKPVWGTLFHPEVSSDRAKERLSLFLDLDQESEEFKQKTGNIGNTSKSQKVIHEFVNYCRVDNSDK